MDSEWWLSNGPVSISGGYLKSPYHPVCPFICLSASSMCNYSHAKECVRNSIHCIRIIIIKPVFVLNHVQYSKILHTIGLFCGYAIRSGRHPEGSQLPPGRPHIAHGSWLYWIPQGLYPTYNSVQLYVWNYLKKVPQRYMCPNFNREYRMVAALQRRKLYMFSSEKASFHRERSLGEPR